MNFKWHNITHDIRCLGNVLKCECPITDPSNDWFLEVHVLLPQFGVLHTYKRFLDELRIPFGETYE